jgi:hypothetical protein
MDYFETREEGKIQIDPLLDLVSSLDRNGRRDLITPHRKSATGAISKNAPAPLSSCGKNPGSTLSLRRERSRRSLDFLVPSSWF